MPCLCEYTLQWKNKWGKHLIWCICFAIRNKNYIPLCNSEPSSDKLKLRYTCTKSFHFFQIWILQKLPVLCCADCKHCKILRKDATNVYLFILPANWWDWFLYSFELWVPSLYAANWINCQAAFLQHTHFLLEVATCVFPLWSTSFFATSL